MKQKIVRRILFEKLTGKVKSKTIVIICNETIERYI